MESSEREWLRYLSVLNLGKIIYNLLTHISNVLPMCYL
jgi:hypothetical protein